jgi:hypothetical protein
MRRMTPKSVGSSFSAIASKNTPAGRALASRITALSAEVVILVTGCALRAARAKNT